MTNEVRTTSATGGQKGVKDERFDLIPIDALTQLARHYGVGARKYDDNQWRKGYEWSKSYAALLRHLTQWWGGEDTDEETGSSHLVAVAWHAFTLLTFIKDHPQFDDRFSTTNRKNNVLDEELERLLQDTPKPYEVGDKVDIYPLGDYGSIVVRHNEVGTANSLPPALEEALDQEFNDYMDAERDRFYDEYDSGWIPLVFGAASSGQESARESLKALATEYAEDGRAHSIWHMPGTEDDDCDCADERDEPPMVTIIYNGFIAGPEGTERAGQPVYIDPVTKGYRLYDGGDN